MNYWNPACHRIATGVAGVYSQILNRGAMDSGACSCGMIAGSIHEIRTVNELIDRIMSEAERLIRERLAAMLNDAR
ncbi:hypothetical protein [Noviherbaspirillum soli]|uniref:hypothetical protein n=1 Tax=Noviherbaspirillum soli TaxID=1064518 RepID=UPI00188A0011|nr:hypothetical protein [Noviherbaspirillum soli]